MSSWVKVSRKLLTSAIASKPEYLAVWMHLILSASYKAGDVLVGHQVVRLEAGQLVFGRIKFAQQIGVSEHTLRMALKSLETLQQITIKSHSKFSVISVVNWAKYQTDLPANHQQTTSKPPASRHNKEVQEIQEEDQRLLSSQANDESSANEKTEKLDPIPYEAIFSAYAQALPELPQIKIKDEARRKTIRSLWRSDKRFQSVEFWGRYYGSVRESKFLMGMNAIGFDWLMKPANFKKVAEGNYQ